MVRDFGALADKPCGSLRFSPWQVVSTILGLGGVLGHALVELADRLTFAWETAKIYEKLPQLGMKGNPKCEYWLGEMLRKREKLTNHNLSDVLLVFDTASLRMLVLPYNCLFR
ncbi:MAG: hypothetical protein ABH814_02990 [bacterium]